MSGGDQPNADEIEAWFAGVAEGRVSRDAADRWAGRWYGDDELEWGGLSRWALGLLCSGIPRGRSDATFAGRPLCRMVMPGLRRVGAGGCGAVSLGGSAGS
ncbi:hypothetical protein [Streptomyces sp. Wb2n-11]|uniref:hypothetical protein n=1 Tax=Streptomyces sp. Wb2n-11 TaxID=1030533 RepID=UPI000B06FF68|nr:hypothetical protein [Streptomyces sp. Wb2n-11]